MNKDQKFEDILKMVVEIGNNLDKLSANKAATKSIKPNVTKAAPKTVQPTPQNVTRTVDVYAYERDATVMKFATDGYQLVEEKSPNEYIRFLTFAKPGTAAKSAMPTNPWKL